MKLLSQAQNVLRLLLARAWIAILLLLALVAGWLLKAGLSPAQSGQVTGMESEHAGHDPGAQAAVPELWTCAMHPRIQMTEPGQCPLCGMDLVPAKTSAGDDESMRRLTVRPAARALMRIQTNPVERRFVEAEVRMVGKIEYDETRLAYLTAWVPGRIDRLYVDFTGVEVQQGEHMVYLYSPKLYADQTALLESLGRVKRLEEGGIDQLADTAYATLDAARERLRQLGLTQAQIDEIEARGKPSDHLTIYAPMGGVVVHRNGQAGMYVQEGTRIYTIADLTHLWVQLDAYESDLLWLRYGQVVEFTTEAYPGEVFTGTIAFLSPELDSRTRTVKVRVNLDNPEGKLKPEMFVRAVVRTDVAAGGRVMDPDLAGKWICPMHPEVVRDEPGACNVCEMDLVTTESRGYMALPDDATEMPLVIPASAALITGTRAIVYVELPDASEPTFEGREIVLGPRAGDWYLVRSGLEEGERVVTQGNFKIDSELQIRAKPSMMTPEGGGGGGHQHHGGDQLKEEGDVEKTGALDVPAASRRQLAGVEQAWIGIQAARESGQIVTLRAAFGSLGEAVAAVERERLEGMARAMWTEIAMLLTNDAVEGEAVEHIEEADRLIALVRRDMERLSASFGTGPDRAVSSPLEVPPAFRRKLTDLWKAYVELHAALAGDDEQAARDAVGLAREARNEVDMSHLGTGETHAAWMQAAAALDAALASMEAATEIEALRGGFESFSKELAVVVRTFGLEGVDVYEIDCPMAFGRGAHWLQDDEDVRNPYYGASMLGCGDVVEKLAEGHDE